MIVTTTKIINDVEYEYTYSDAGMMIERDGARYSEAVDPMGSNRQYTETDIPVDYIDGEDATEADYQAALRDMGVCV